MNSRSEFFTTSGGNGVRLHTLHWGDADREPLVLLHGGGANAHWWDHLAPTLAERFHVIALDFRGHGDSDQPEDLVAGAFERDLEALLAKLGTSKVVLVGHSMGAHVAVSHAARAPETRALALFDLARGGTRRASRRMRLALSFRRSYVSAEEARARLRFLPPAEHATEELRAAIAAYSVQREADGRYGYKFDRRWFSLPPRPPPKLERITCPTLLLRGDQSTVLTEEGARLLCHQIRDASLVTIHRAGHHVQLDNPSSVLQALQHFLTERLPATAEQSG